MARFLSRNPAGTVADDHLPGIAELGPPNSDRCEVWLSAVFF
jgi:hypothetical protein